MLPADTIASSQGEEVLRAILALIVVAALIVLTALAARKLGLDKYWGAAKISGKRRLQVVETLYLDPRTKICIVRVDNQEHAILVGTSASVLLHSAAAKEEIAPNNA